MRLWLIEFYDCESDSTDYELSFSQSEETARYKFINRWHGRKIITSIEPYANRK